MISDRHSINRVKWSLARAEQYDTVRAARHRIACLKWLGRWGLALNVRRTQF